MMALVALLLLGAAVTPGRATAEERPVSAQPVILPLTGPVALPDSEISAMCWCGDRLILLPQHPERFGGGDGGLEVFTLDRADIERAIDEPAAGPLAPRPVVLEAPALTESIPGWEGIEAAVTVGDVVYMAVESRRDGEMGGHLLRGHVVPAGDNLRIVLDTERIVPIPVPTRIPNMSQEALVVWGERVAVIFEANGANVNPGAHVVFFDLDLAYRGTAPMETVEYRITDACSIEADGTFWVINYFFPGEGPVLDPPVPLDHPVEHLLQLKFDGDRVVRSGLAPLDLRLDRLAPPRNWEALACLSGRGFLLMTDRYPTTLLAFVPFVEPGTHSGERP